MSEPPLTFWVTSTGRSCVLDCVRETVKWCDYPNYRMLIFESQPDNPHGTVEAFRALPCEKKVWTGDYPPLGFIYNTFMEKTERFFVRLDDDCHPVCSIKDMVTEAIDLLTKQPLMPEYPIATVPLEMNPRMAYDLATGTAPEGANRIPRFIGYDLTTDYGPLALVGHPGSLPVTDKRFLLPWNETCHWRQTELYYILDLERRGIVSAYMLKWWGIMGHFSSAGVDGVSRAKNLRLYEAYRDRGYSGRRPEDAWATVFLGENLPDRKAVINA